MLGRRLQEVLLPRAPKSNRGVQQRQPLPQARHLAPANNVWHLLHHQIPESGAPQVLKLYFQNPALVTEIFTNSEIERYVGP